MDALQQNQQLKKHIGTVHIAAPLSLVQRKAFSVLLLNAYPNLQKQQIHTMPMSVLCELIGFDSNNTAKLRDALRRLMSTGIEWLGTDDKQWAATTFMASVEIANGVCTYEYSSFLSKRLYNPEIYARINVGILRYFESRYAIALYENCARYRPNGDFKGGTPEWSLDDFRLLMGASGDYYSEVKRLNAKVIVPAVTEINKYSDIIVTPKFRKVGRKVVGIRFAVQDNAQMSFDILTQPEEAQRVTAHPLLVEMKERYHVPELLAAGWLDLHGEERFREVIRMADNLAEAGKLKNPIGFIRSSFEQGYTQGKPVEEIQAELQAAKSSRKVASKSKSNLAKQRREVEKHIAAFYADHLQKEALRRLEALPKPEQERAISAWLNGEGMLLREKYRDPSNVKSSTMAMSLLAAHLASIWELEKESPMAAWQQEEGLEIQEVDSEAWLTKGGEKVDLT